MSSHLLVGTRLLPGLQSPRGWQDSPSCERCYLVTFGAKLCKIDSWLVSRIRQETGEVGIVPKANVALGAGFHSLSGRVWRVPRRRDQTPLSPLMRPEISATQTPSPTYLVHKTPTERKGANQFLS